VVADAPLSVSGKVGDELGRVYSECVREIEKFDDIDPALASLALTNKGLRFPDAVGEINLRQTCELPSLPESFSGRGRTGPSGSISPLRIGRNGTTLGPPSDERVL